MNTMHEFHICRASNRLPLDIFGEDSWDEETPFADNPPVPGATLVKEKISDGHIRLYFTIVLATLEDMLELATDHHILITTATGYVDGMRSIIIRDTYID